MTKTIEINFFHIWNPSFLGKFFNLHPVRNNARCSAADLGFNTIPAGFNAPLEFLTGFTFLDGGIKKFIQINWSWPLGTPAYRRQARTMKMAIGLG